jgi:hypothetical protein
MLDEVEYPHSFSATVLRYDCNGRCRLPQAGRQAGKTISKPLKCSGVHTIIAIRPNRLTFKTLDLRPSEVSFHLASSYFIRYHYVVVVVVVVIIIIIEHSFRQS